MGILLKRVLSTNNKGLIGITESGEKVTLSKPTPMGIVRFYEAPNQRGVRKEFIEDSRSEIGLLHGDKDVYIQLGKIHTALGEFLQPYNVYTRRK